MNPLDITVGTFCILIVLYILFNLPWSSLRRFLSKDISTKDKKIEESCSQVYSNDYDRIKNNHDVIEWLNNRQKNKGEHYEEETYIKKAQHIKNPFFHLIHTLNESTEKGGKSIEPKQLNHV